MIDGRLVKVGDVFADGGSVVEITPEKVTLAEKYGKQVLTMPTTKQRHAQEVLKQKNQPALVSGANFAAMNSALAQAK